MTERTSTQAPGLETQGGGFRGGPKRWTGRGPPPARHIPWPEIFKHHISVIEGHLKMVDMVRKHTADGTGNFRTIMGCVDRAKEMLSVSKKIQYSFVPPPNQREQVPIGVSSDSMYPGYSPADHEYGKAAEEYGKAVAEAKAKGVEIPIHPDIEYKIGQGKGNKRKTLAQMRELSGGNKEQSGSGSGSGEGSASEGPLKKQKTNGIVRDVEKAVDAPRGGDNLFFIDTKPTPVNLPGHISAPSPTKRQADEAEAAEGKKPKKSKRRHSGDLPDASAKTEETEDISTEVEARMKEKEEKKKRKEEKKRKRGSEKSIEAAVESAADVNAAPPDLEKPKKKKKKVKSAEEEEGLPDRSAGIKRAGEEEAAAGEDGGKKKKRKKSKE